MLLAVMVPEEGFDIWWYLVMVHGKAFFNNISSIRSNKCIFVTCVTTYQVTSMQHISAVGSVVLVLEFSNLLGTNPLSTSIVL